MTAEQQLKKFLLQKRTPLFSSKYEIHQAIYYQKSRKLFYSSLQYIPSLDGTLAKYKILCMKQTDVNSYRLQCHRQMP